MKKNKKFQCILMFFFLSFFWIIASKKVDAENLASMDEGVVTYVAPATTATTSTTWRTMGFTVKNKETKGDPTQKPKGQFWLDDGENTSKVVGAITYTTFTFKEDKVRKEFDNAKIDAASLAENGGNVYLNGIFQVYENGKATGSFYHTLNGISSARNWASTSEFSNRFDIIVPYSGKKNQPIYLTTMKYSSKGYSFVSREKIGTANTHSYFETATGDIPGTIVSDVTGNTLYLYRTHWAYMEEAEKVRSNGTYRTMRGIEKTYINPKLYWEDYKTDLQRLRIRKYDVQYGGIEIVCIYKAYSETSGSSSESEMSGDLTEPFTEAVIQADSRGSEQFDSTQGIPTTEYQYVNAKSNTHLLDYTFKKTSGEKVYNVPIKVTYYLSWTVSVPDGVDANGYPKYKPENRSDTETITQTYQVKRKYSYWEVSRLNVYKIASGSIYNYSLPGGSVNITSSYTAPTVQHIKTSDHMVEPTIPSLSANGGSVSGGSSRPTVSTKDFSSLAESSLEKIKVKNDKVTFNGTVYMDNEQKEEETSKPTAMPVIGEVCNQNTLYRSSLQIERNKANGEFESEGIITYSSIYSTGASEGATLEYDIENINSVIIHTPTICDAQMSSNKADNQMISPDRSVVSLVLDRNFSVKLPTVGYHSSLKGYQYRDYAKYIENRQVKFPFGVYRGTSYISGNTWVTLSSEETSFYLPIWVDEGSYTIDFRSISINSSANGGIDRTEELANMDHSNYVATDTVEVQVSGRIYGINLYDVSDYPIWEPVFRQANSLQLTGFKYTVGTRNQNGAATGQNARYTFPLVNGSHPSYSTVGVLKPGYVNRFSLTTIGNMYSENDSIQIKPTFYFVSADGSGRQEIDLYYSETFSGKKNHLVKVGSILDATNVKTYRFGDSYLSVPESEIAVTAAIKGKALKDLKAVKKDLFTYKYMKIPSDFQTLVGNTYHNSLGLGTPVGVSSFKVGSSMQKWYAEYYLPSEVYAAPKGFNVIKYATDHGITYKESFWLKDGYIVVNFAIETIRDGESHLTYINPENASDGYCNMWNREGFQYTKADNKGNTFHFLDGDYVLYYADSRNFSAGKDYRAGGTH